MIFESTTMKIQRAFLTIIVLCLADISFAQKFNDVTSEREVLIIYGDNLENDTGVPGHSWKTYYDGWNKFVTRLKEAGGTARMMHLPALGIRGNSHMLMMDTNNQQIADLILEWIATLKK